MQLSELINNPEVITSLNQNDVFIPEDFEKITLCELTDYLGSDKTAKSLKKTLENNEIFLKQSDSGVTFKKRMGFVRSRELTA
jgi:hypothetical protein